MTSCDYPPEFQFATDKELQYNVLHNIYISPYIYSKYTAGVSPNCPKCKSHAGTRLHCLWEYNTIQVFWRAICANISIAIGQQVSPNPLLCLLGNVPNFLKQHEEVIQSLLMLARKAIMVKWVGDDPPSVLMWKSLISEVMALEKLGHYQWEDSYFSAEMEETIGTSWS